MNDTALSNDLPETLIPKAQQALGFAQQQIRRLITEHPDYFPLYTQQGRWYSQGESWTNWCEGFLGGMLWIFAQRTGDTWWREQAEHYSKLIEPRKLDTTVHDLGFLFMPTWEVWYNLTGDKKIQENVIIAGQTLAKRFNEKGHYLRSFVAPESCFIDIMMNVGIIFYAAVELGDDRLLNIARQHCLTTRRCLMRGDGSTSHEGIFDLETGTFLRQTTQQGWRDDSSWARGQAWAIGGFGTAYRFTHDVTFLDTAQRCADFYIARTPANGIPPNDWDEPHPTQPYESSAAAIAAWGMWQLAELCLDPSHAATYSQYATNIIATLCTPEFLANETPGWEGILKHGSYHERKKLGVDESVMWGDYFFVATLHMMLEKKR